MPPAGAAIPYGVVRPATTATGIAAPYGITKGPDGNLWFTNSGTYPGYTDASIGRVTPAGVVTLFPGTGISNPWGITAGPDGNLWFTNTGNGSIGRITPQGVVTNYPAAGVEAPMGITTGPDGNLWFTTANSIGRITPAGIVTTFNDPGIYGLAGITAGPDGNLWFTNATSIGRITPAGTISIFATGSANPNAGIAVGPDGNLWFTVGVGGIGHSTTAGAYLGTTATTLQHPVGITAGPDGNMWVTDRTGSGEVDKLSPAGWVTATYSGVGSAAVGGIAAGADGNMWLANGSGNTVTRVTPAGTVTPFRGGIVYPREITTGPDGNLWFTSGAANAASIGRITPSGAVTTFAVPPPATGLQGIAAGADGNLWFTIGGASPTYAESSIGRITTTGAITTFAGPGIANPQGITAGPDGNLWFTNFGNGGSIGRMTPDGVVTTFVGEGIFGEGIVAGGDGNLWFSNSDPSRIGRITPAGETTIFTEGISFPGGLAAGPDGNVWFTNVSTDSIGMITPEGFVTDFGHAPGIGRPYAITAGSDGSLWFVNTGTDHIDGWPTSEPTSIGRITTAGEVSTFEIPFESFPQSIAAGPDGNVWFTRGDHAIGRVLLAGVPGAPSGVAGSGGNGSVTVTWGAVGNLSPITAYTVTAAPGGATCTWSSGPRSCVVSGLTNGTAYTFTVTATNDLGTGVASAASAPVVPTRFTDVPLASPFYADIDWLVGRSITGGYDDRSFRPIIAVSRQAMAAFLYRAAGRPNGPAPTCAEAPFVDVAVDAPFCGEITWLVDEGITVGYPDGGFHPAAPVSRQAMAAFLYRWASTPSDQDPACLDEAPFSDVPIEDPFCGAISWLVANGMAEGYDDGTFRPSSSVSRQATAAFLHRLDALLHP